MTTHPLIFHNLLCKGPQTLIFVAAPPPPPQVEFHVCACTAFHFQITLSQYNDCFSHVQCGVYIPGFIQWEASAGFPPRILGVE